MEAEAIEEKLVQTWDFSDPVGSERDFLDLAAQAEEQGERAIWLTQAARARGLLRDFNGASQLLVEADEAGGPSADSHVRARVSIERGRVLNTSGAPEEALPHFRQAADAAEESRLAGLHVDALHMTAIALGRAAGAAESAAANERALAVADASTDPAARRWRASLLNNLGWDRHTLGDFAGALKVFTHAVDARRATGDDDGRVIAEWAVARTLRSLGRYDEALAIQVRLANEPTGADDGYVFEECGECLLALGRAEEAGPWFGRAYELFSRDDFLVDSEPERLARLAELSGWRAKQAMSATACSTTDG